MPFDDNRVILKCAPDSPPGEDYINASYLSSLYGDESQYIATQGISSNFPVLMKISSNSSNVLRFLANGLGTKRSSHSSYRKSCRI